MAPDGSAWSSRCRSSGPTSRCIIEDWLANGRGEPGTLDLFPSERGGLVVESTLIRRVRRYCEELGLSDGLDLHSFRSATSATTSPCTRTAPAQSASRSGCTIPVSHEGRSQ